MLLKKYLKPIPRPTTTLSYVKSWKKFRIAAYCLGTECGPEPYTNKLRKKIKFPMYDLLDVRAEEDT